MKCPRCKKDLKVMHSNNVQLDVCFGGCGGIWFDKFEIAKLDEKHEADPAFLKSLENSKLTTINPTQRLNCPKCIEVVMLRNFFSAKREVEVDHCAGCGGYWLDVGELTRIHAEFSTEAERNKAASQLFDEVSKPLLEQLRAENESERATARHVVNALRFFSPSWYIPGKQKWGGH